MRNRERFWATVVIWLVFVLLVAAFFAFAILKPGTPLYSSTIETILIVFSATAAVSTLGIWLRSGGEPYQEQSEAKGAARKAKSEVPRRIADMIDRLNDEEIIELEALLTPQDEPLLHRDG